jgi:Mrp family chromosome partitioning ATPase/capsular polysaccharide biosynthesis protein
MSSGDAGNVMGSPDYKGLLRRQWLPILLCLALGIGAAVAYLAWAPREYTAQTSVLVTATNSPTNTPARNVPINLETEAQLVTSTETVAAAAELLEVPADEVDSLARRVAVSVPPSSEILAIAFTDDSARAAQQGSRAFAQAYLDQREQAARAALDAEDEAIQGRIDVVSEDLEGLLDEARDLPAGSAARSRVDAQITALNNQLASLGSQQNEIRSTSVTPGSIVTEPTLPSSPSSPDPLIALAAGALLGLLLGLGIALLRHWRDDVVRSPDDLHRRTRLPAIAVLSARLKPSRVSIVQPLSADGRGYARLRNLVTARLEDSDRKVVLVAGVRRGGGPVATNLAASLARAGEEVFLVCADVFGHTANSLLGERPADGLAEVLAGELPVDAAARRLDGLPNLRILGPGRDPDRADALLQTRGPRDLVDGLLESAAYVVIEAPSTTDSPDAQTLANVAGLAVLVVETDSTSGREVLDACAQLESMRTAVLGAVLARYGRDGGHSEEPAGATRRSPAPVGDDSRDTVLVERAQRTQPIDTSGSSTARAGVSSDPVTPGSRDHASR